MKFLAWGIRGSGGKGYDGSTRDLQGGLSLGGWEKHAEEVIQCFVTFVVL